MKIPSLVVAFVIVIIMIWLGNAMRPLPDWIGYPVIAVIVAAFLWLAWRNRD